MLKLDLIGIVTADMTKALAFYRELGLAIPIDAEKEDHVECVLPNGLRVAWDTVELIKSFADDWVEPAGHRIGIAFLCESATQVDETYERLVGFGAIGKRAPWDAFWGQRYAQIEDPDGNLVDLFASLSA